MASIPDEIRELVQHMSPSQQEDALRLMQTLANTVKPLGTPGKDQLRFAGTLSPEAIQAMREAHEACEIVDDE